MSSHTFLWHDYETFGAMPRRDRPAQFAAIRTDAELNEIGEPIMIYCRPAPDFMPDPVACLITGITPQACLERGIPEHEFAAQIERAMAATGTIGVGYNTIRFDDEVTRYLFWRNLIDPYAREWQNSCGRWDLLDVVRTAYALKSDGIEWPKHPDGRPSFKLEDLARANGLVHEAAHDALSDVRATIALARLVRGLNPKLFDFCLGLHKKDRAAQEFGWPQRRPLLHITGMYPAEQGCVGLVYPLAVHPTNKNEMIVWDLAHDPSELHSIDPDTMRLRMFSKTADLPEGVTRLPVKTIHLNKSPVIVANFRSYQPHLADKWGMDLDRAMRHAELAADPALHEKLEGHWKMVFQRPPEAAADVDEDLYGGFVGNNDRRTLTDLRAMSPQKLAAARPSFQDARLEELVFRYRARNFPETLSEEETERWQEHCAARLIHGQGGARSFNEMSNKIEELSETADDEAQAVLSDLYDYGEMIASQYA